MPGKKKIYAEDLMDAIRDDPYISGRAFARVKQHIDDAPDAVKRGRKAESAISKTGLMCTACYSDIDRDAVFCKYCGAKMDGGGADA